MPLEPLGNCGEGHDEDDIGYCYQRVVDELVDAAARRGCLGIDNKLDSKVYGTGYRPFVYDGRFYCGVLTVGDYVENIKPFVHMLEERIIALESQAAEKAPDVTNMKEQVILEIDARMEEMKKEVTSSKPKMEQADAAMKELEKEVTSSKTKMEQADARMEEMKKEVKSSTTKMQEVDAAMKEMKKEVTSSTTTILEVEPSKMTAEEKQKAMDRANRAIQCYTGMKGAEAALKNNLAILASLKEA